MGKDKGNSLAHLTRLSFSPLTLRPLKEYQRNKRRKEEKVEELKEEKNPRQVLYLGR